MGWVRATAPEGATMFVRPLAVISAERRPLVLQGFPSLHSDLVPPGCCLPVGTAPIGAKDRRDPIAKVLALRDS